MNNFMKNFWIGSCFIAALLISCSTNSPVNTKISPITAIPEWTSTPILRKSPSIDSTITPSKSTIECLKTLADLPKDGVPGTLVFGQIFGNTPLLPAFLWDFNNGQKMNLPREKEEYFLGDSVVVSPDRKRLAYMKYFNSIESDEAQIKLYIVDSSGDLLKEITVSKEESLTTKKWGSLISWQDNHKLLIDINASTSPFPVIVLDPFTDSSEEITPDFPNIYKTSHNFMAWWHSYEGAMTIYDSTFQLVVYPQTPNDIILWDIDRHLELAKIHTNNPYGSTPKWSPDHQRFAMDASSGLDYFNDELFIVDREGKIKTLTNFSNTIGPVDIQEYDWSLDGQEIAFWYSKQPNDKKGTYELATLKLSTGEITNYCIFDHIRQDEIALLSPIWSPDGEQLLVRGNIENEDNTKDYNILLLNIKKGYVVQVEKNVVPLGWMVSDK